MTGGGRRLLGTRPGQLHESRLLAHFVSEAEEGERALDYRVRRRRAMRPMEKMAQPLAEL